jgi:hypothetical protein
LVIQKTTGNVGIGTTSPQWPLTVYSATGGQLSLSAGAGLPQVVMRNTGSAFYIATTTLAGSATSSPFAFKIDLANGMTSFIVPHIQFSSLEDQTCTAANTAYPVTFNTHDDYHGQGFTHSTSVNNATTTINYEGTYEIILSAIALPDTVNKSINLWLRVNNADVANSNTRVVLANSVDSMVAVSLFYHFMVGDTFQIKMASDDAGTILDYTAASGPVPASPSIIMTAKRISGN